jgi:nucleoside-diphosphate-sugar epimerase
MSKLLITGSTGFLGKALCKNLKIKKHLIHTAIRSENQILIEGTKSFNVGDICSTTKWKNALMGIDCVIHCAARTHVMKEEKKNQLLSYRKINVEGTKNLAIQAASQGVKRFIFISSIKVNGEQTVGCSSFNSNNNPKPEDAYGISKWEAEQTLWNISKLTGLEVVIIRPPLVYGEEVKGNFLRLLDLIYKGVPLPLAGIKNNRSFLGIENLIDAITQCIDHPKASGNTFLISDLECISTSDLINKLARLMKKPSRLFSVPISLIKLIGYITGKSLEIKRLLYSLQVDSSNIRKALGWTPPFSLDEGLKKTVKWYLNSR